MRNDDNDGLDRANANTFHSMAVTFNGGVVLGGLIKHVHR